MKLQEWKKNFSLSEFVISNMDHKTMGGKVFVCCPFHHEETASCLVDDTHFKCFGAGCGAHGDALDFLKQSYGLTISEILNSKDLRPQNIIVPSNRKREPKQKKEIPLPSESQIRRWNNSLMANNEIVKYLNGRHIPVHGMKSFMLGYGITDYYHGEKIVIPVFNNHSLVNMRYRAAPNKDDIKYLAHPGKSPSLFNLDALQNDKIIIAGSELDAIALSSNGIPSVSLPGEGVFMDEWIPLFSGKKVLVWLDYDWPGIEGAIKVYNKIKIVAKTTIFDWPNVFSNGDDIEDFITKMGMPAAQKIYECLI